MPLKVPFAIWPVSATHCACRSPCAVGVIAASASEPLETVKPTPPAPIVRLWPTGMTRPSVVSVALSRSGPGPAGGARGQLPFESARSIVPSPFDVDADRLLLEGEGDRPVDEAEEVEVRGAGRGEQRAAEVDRRCRRR